MVKEESIETNNFTNIYDNIAEPGRLGLELLGVLRGQRPSGEKDPELWESDGRGAAKSFDAAIGYFNLRGWEKLGQALEDRFAGAGETAQKHRMPLVRVLIGMTLGDREMQHRIEAACGQEEDTAESDSSESMKILVAREKALNGFRRQLGRPTPQNHRVLEQLRKQLGVGQVQVKLFTAKPLHSKVYIFGTGDRHNPLIAYVGSSNLTLSGLAWEEKRSYELNMKTTGTDDTTRLKEWFQDRWDDSSCIDITADLINLLEVVDKPEWQPVTLKRNNPNQLSPYEMYALVCYLLSNDVRQEKEQNLPESIRGELFEFQEQAARVLSARIRRWQGAMLADTVGLGKTITAIAVAAGFQRQENSKVLILCPANLQNMWEQEASRRGVEAKVLSHGKLKELRPDEKNFMGCYDFLIIDESHNFRNRNHEGRKQIKEYVSYCRGAGHNCRVLLLTATPYNTGLENIGRQLELYLDQEQDLGLEPSPGGKRNLPENVRTINAFLKSKNVEDWRPLVNEHLVRRNLSWVQKHYGDEGKLYLSNGESFTFPKREPEIVDVKFPDDDPAQVVLKGEYANMIDQLSLPRYNLRSFIPEEKKSQLEGHARRWYDDARAGLPLQGIVRTQMYKRLSSSGHALFRSLCNHIVRNLVYLQALEEGESVPVGSYSLADVELEDPECEALEERIGEFVSGKGPLEEALTRAAENSAKESDSDREWLPLKIFDTQRLKDALEKDNQLLWHLLDNLVAATEYRWLKERDSKLRALVDLLKNKPEDKFLIFTEYRDTAQYLRNSLQEEFPGEVDAIVGGDKELQKKVRLFSPLSNGVKEVCAKELRILVATDTLSEGQNLQDCHRLVNYDLPWAPVVLTQRAGRVSRLGQKSDTVIIYLITHDSLEAHLDLQERLQRRLHENAEVIGSDEYFFDLRQELRELGLLATGGGDNSAGSGGADAPAASSLTRSDSFEVEADPVSRAHQAWTEMSKSDPELEKATVRRVEQLRSGSAGPYLSSAVDIGASETPSALVYLRTTKPQNYFGKLGLQGKPEKSPLISGDDALRCFEALKDEASMGWTENFSAEKAEELSEAMGGWVKPDLGSLFSQNSAPDPPVSVAVLFLSPKNKAARKSETQNEH